MWQRSTKFIRSTHFRSLSCSGWIFPVRSPRVTYSASQFHWLQADHFLPGPIMQGRCLFSKSPPQKTRNIFTTYQKTFYKNFFYPSRGTIPGKMAPFLPTWKNIPGIRNHGREWFFTWFSRHWPKFSIWTWESVPNFFFTILTSFREQWYIEEIVTSLQNHFYFIGWQYFETIFTVKVPCFQKVWLNKEEVMWV